MAAAIEVGRVCLKMRGREAGRKAVIVDIPKGMFALVDGPNIKRRKCNLRHLIPTNQKIEVKKDASHEEILNLLGVKPKPKKEKSEAKKK